MMYVSGGDTVHRGQLLALVASTARYEDVEQAEFLLQGDVQTVDAAHVLSALQLGDRQQAWIEYLALCSDYGDYLSIDRIGKKKALLSAQVQRANTTAVWRPSAGRWSRNWAMSAGASRVIPRCLPRVISPRRSMSWP